MNKWVWGMGGMILMRKLNVFGGRPVLVPLR